MVRVHVRIYATGDDGMTLLRMCMPPETKLRAAMLAWCRYFSIGFTEVSFVYNLRVLSQHETLWELGVRRDGGECNMLALPRLRDERHDVLSLSLPYVYVPLRHIRDVLPDELEDAMEDSFLIDALRLQPS